MFDWTPISMTPFLVALLLLAGMAWSIFFRKLTPRAALAGGVAGWIIYSGAGFTGLIFNITFFLLGTLATSWRREEKKKLIPEDAEAGARTAQQVLANAGVAAICAWAAMQYPRRAPLLHLMVAASFAAATADTLSSELGTVYGRRFYNCLSWRPDTRGLNGVISLEGTLIGIAGACIIAGIYGLRLGWTKDCLLIVIAGAIGSYVDSVLGARFERAGRLSNDWVNFLSICIAALAAGIMRSIL